jgi:hypothetical protein
MVGIPSISTSDRRTEWSHVYISPFELATNSNSFIVLSLVVAFEILMVFLGKFVFQFHENRKEEWTAFHQYSHLLVIPSGPISNLAQSS